MSGYDCSRIFKPVLSGIYTEIEALHLVFRSHASEIDRLSVADPCLCSQYEHIDYVL